MRLAGQDPQLVYFSDEPEPALAGVDAALTARITLRLPEALKTMVEDAAAREGVSVNTWIVRALSRESSNAPRPQSRLTGYAHR